MADEPPDTEPQAEGSPNEVIETDERILGIQTGEQHTLFITVHGANYGTISVSVEAALLVAISVYSKAFLEAMAKRHADGFADLARTLFRRRKDRSPEARIGLDDDAAAAVIVTSDLPDEARLALLDLDVTAPELRGKELRWDTAEGEWRPFEVLPADEPWEQPIRGIPSKVLPTDNEGAR